MKKFLMFIMLFELIIFPQSLTKISEALSIKISSINSSDKILVWIFFTDKTNNSQSYFSNPQSVVSQKSLQRRMKVFDSDKLIEETDLPINQNYINALEEIGIKIKHKSKWFNSVSCFVFKNDLIKISSLPFVKQIDIVYQFKKEKELMEDNIPVINTNYQVNSINAYDYGNSLTQNQQINVPAVHNLGFRGQGVTVGIFDAGFNRLTHESFSTMSIIAKWDFVNHGPNVGDSTGLQGSGSHGTQTLSTIGGFKQGKLIGPAFGANFILAKTENTFSETPIEEDNWMAAVEWADSIGVDIITSSLGYISFDPPYVSYTWQSMNGNTCRITIGADLAVKKGIAVFNSAGNEGFNSSHNTLGAPSDGDSVIAIGAVTSTGVRASFSSVGNTIDGRTKPDVVAMGSGVTVASSSNNTGYSSASGTSFSCPLSAGVGALVLSYNPSLTPIQLREALRMTASNKVNPNREIGWGILNAFNAINYFATPVELISFSVSLVDGNNLLRWTTSTEKNNKGFYILKSDDKINWREIGFINGNGTSTFENKYSFYDYEKIYGKHFYKLQQIDFNGTFSYSKIIEADFNSINKFDLFQNYPNPFSIKSGSNSFSNSSTNIKFRIANSGFVTLKVFDVLGKEIATLVSEEKEAGIYEIPLNSNHFINNKEISSGIYFVQLNNEGITKQIKINVIK